MKRNKYITIAFTCILLASVFSADRFFNLGLGSRIITLVRPIGIVLNQSGGSLTSGFSSLKNIGTLQKDNSNLNARLNDALAEIARLSEAQKENAQLKLDLGYKKQSDFDLVAANIIAYDPTNVQSSITIDRGKNDGLSNGNSVISEGFLAGKIIDISANTAKIRLISDPNSAIPATIQNSSTSGIVKGRIGNGLTMEQVPQSDLVRAGDMVLTSGLGGEYPKGLIIGKVEDIQKVSGSIFQIISVRSLLGLDALNRVMVIRG